MKTTTELIRENIARFEVTCKQIDKSLIEHAELIATQKEVLNGRIESIDSTEKWLNSLRKQYKIKQS